MPRIVFELADGEERTVEAREGYTVMEEAVNAGVPGIEAECGGSLSCSTCHCYVDPSWTDRTGTAEDDEAALLAFAWEPGPTSRLTCQLDVSTDLDGLRLRVPARQA